MYTAVYTAVLITYSCTASAGNDGAGAVDCDSQRAVGHVRTIRGVYRWIIFYLDGQYFLIFVSSGF